MNAHKATRSRSRRRRPGRTHATARRGGKGTWPVGLTAVAVLVLAGSAVTGWTSFSSTTEGNAASGRSGRTAGPPTPGPPSVPSKSPSRRQPGHRATPGSAASTSRPSVPSLPVSGPGTFTTAPGTSTKAGRGKTLRYRVDIEDGLSLSAADVAAQVESILADRRGWTANGTSAFQRVSSGPTDFAVRVATPRTVDEICGRYGLDTGGELNCDVGRQVMVNLKRWLLATPVYAKDVTAYRALIINHEVGHFLGHGHVGCPGGGEPAPVMMQQIKGMHGCTPNVWPYDTHGRYITGPASP
ncbi:DUF3152 domain-containing protein [Streptomyces sp. MUM 136J]|uniref:DUF3152 domain-containing protein n=1 Tax=Streptomyces sp. MUM 136J TaxID=2791992 RepID=UPI001F04CA3D|nr:DUF3152 domain-containing protein [Streptomyces sp. MUM 136J]MCH0571898.1 DUF3152 domain-containing protein [Streptomyces sp. MUM 136J]